MREMAAKGRARNGGGYKIGDVRHRGEDSHMSKLTEDQAREVLATYVPRHPEFGAHALGRRFGVSKTAISKILSGENWSYLRIA
ncbi:hypothetical protein LCGC14_2424610, partial [marine sediment metagenome]